MSKIKIFTFFVFLLLTGIAEYAIASPPQVRDETSGWKTYRNEQYGFEVRYPAQMSVEENPPYLLLGGPMDSKSNISFFYQNKNYLEEHPFEFYASVFTNDKQFLPQQWFISKEFPSNLGGDRYKTINGITAVGFGAEGADGRTIYFFMGTRVVALVQGEMPVNSFETVVSSFQSTDSAAPVPTSKTEPKESIEYTTPGGISPFFLRALQWLAVLLIIVAFIFKFRLHPFKIIFTILFATISIILLDSCFIVDASSPKFCEYREFSLPVFIFVDPLGDNIRTVAMRNIIMPIAAPLIAFGIWYIIGSLIFTVYRKFSKRSGL